jgi:hypothetical protein
MTGLAYVPTGTIHRQGAALPPPAGALWARALRAAERLGVVAANGLRWTVRSLAFHRPLGALADGRRVVEMCAGWVAKIPGVTHWAARVGWDAVVRAGGLPLWSSAQVRAAGLQPRAAARHGAYVVLDADTLRALRAAAHEWGAAGHLAPDSLDDDPGWVPFDPDRRGQRPNRWQGGHCPFHDDRHPSAGIRWNADGVTGGFHCFGCQRVDGRGTTGIARRSPHGIEVLRVDSPEVDERLGSRLGTHTDSVGTTGTSTFNTRRGRGTQGPAAPDDTGTLQAVKLRADDRPTDHPDHRRWTAYAGTIRDPFVAALRADDRAGWQGRDVAIEEAGVAYNRAAARAKGARPDPRCWWRDDLYTIDEQRPTAWVDRVSRDGARRWSEPTAWTSTARRHALFDLDGLDRLTLEARRRAAAGIARVVALHPDLTGAHMAIVTSYRGLQVLVELRAPVAPGHFGTAPGARWYLALGSALLEAVRAGGATGGQIDTAAMDAGRLGRLPGVRLMKSGVPFAARLIGLALPAGAPLTARDARLAERLRGRVGG